MYVRLWSFIKIEFLFPHIRCVLSFGVDRLKAVHGMYEAMIIIISNDTKQFIMKSQSKEVKGEEFFIK